LTAVEADGIQPLVAHSLALGWLDGVFGVQGTADLFDVFELSCGRRRGRPQ
jgi:hypothetical protein